MSDSNQSLDSVCFWDLELKVRVLSSVGILRSKWESSLFLWVSRSKSEFFYREFDVKVWNLCFCQNSGIKVENVVFCQNSGITIRVLFNQNSVFLQNLKNWISFLSFTILPEKRVVALFHNGSQYLGLSTVPYVLLTTPVLALCPPWVQNKPKMNVLLSEDL